MKPSRIIIIIAVFVLCAFAAGFLVHNKMNSSFDEAISAWIKESNIDQNFIEKIPIYEDYVKTNSEEQLRKYLFQDHYNVVLKAGMQPLSSADDIQSFVEKKLLVPIEPDENALFYFYGVKKENRYLAPRALEALEKVALRFNEKLNAMELPQVKIALSSALRPDEYQKSLRSRNQNATEVSTHSYGMSFDLFYDDFFVVLTTPDGAAGINTEISDKLRRRMGFILGDSLRRQLRTILFQTLVEMQNDGVIYAISERNQHCYHITPTK